jgi:hypothetical protein
MLPNFFHADRPKQYEFLRTVSPEVKTLEDARQFIGSRIDTVLMSSGALSPPCRRDDSEKRKSFNMGFQQETKNVHVTRYRYIVTG